MKELTNRQRDILTELINIGVGKGAQVLNSMIQSHISLQVPELEMIPLSRLPLSIDPANSKSLSAVHMAYEGNFNGEVQLFFPSEEAVKLVKLILEEEFPEDEMDSIRRGTLTEVGTVVINAVIGSISNVFGMRLNYTVPSYSQGTIWELLNLLEYDEMEVLLLAKTHFLVKEKELTGTIVLFFSMESFQALLDTVDSYE